MLADPVSKFLSDSLRLVLMMTQQRIQEIGISGFLAKFCQTYYQALKDGLHNTNQLALIHSQIDNHSILTAKTSLE